MRYVFLALALLAANTPAGADSNATTPAGAAAGAKSSAHNSSSPRTRAARTGKASSIAPVSSASAPAASPTAPAANTSRLNIMRAMLAAKDQPYLEPKGDLKKLLLQQNPELAAPDCGVRYKQLDVADSPGMLTLLVAPQGRCKGAGGAPAEWVLQLKGEAKH